MKLSLFAANPFVSLWITIGRWPLPRFWKYCFANSTSEGRVYGDGTSSSNGMMCGGLNGCTMSSLSRALVTKPGSHLVPLSSSPLSSSSPPRCRLALIPLVDSTSDTPCREHYESSSLALTDLPNRWARYCLLNCAQVMYQMPCSAGPHHPGINSLLRI
jgi:hypothetical protein